MVPGGREVGEHLVTHPGTDKVAFTGSTAAGKRIMSLCGDQVKRVSLELGGKSAAIVARRRRRGRRLPALVSGAMHLSGQVCGAHTRVLVPRSRYAEAGRGRRRGGRGRRRSATRTTRPRSSDRWSPSGSATGSRATSPWPPTAGARVVAGGGRPAHLPKGWYVAPTILADVDNAMRVAREEIFGPVLCVIPYDDEDDAVRIANDSPYGLAGGVWTADPARGLRVARRMRTGQRRDQRQLPAVPAGAVRRVRRVRPGP